MGRQRVDAEAGNEYAVVPTDHDSVDKSDILEAGRYDNASQPRGASIAPSSVSAQGADSSVRRRFSYIWICAFAISGACILWLAAEVSGDEARCNQDNSCGKASISQLIHLFKGQSAFVPVADAGQGRVTQSTQSAMAADEQETRKAEAVARALTSAQRDELNAVRSAAAAAANEQKTALNQERDRADVLERDLETARVDAYLAIVQAMDAELKQRQALEREQARADKLARDLVSLQAELNVAQTSGSKSAGPVAAIVAQKQALEQKYKQEGERAERLTRELTSLRAELETARAESQKTARDVEAARAEQDKMLAEQRKINESLVRELASVKQETGAGEAGQKQALEQRFKLERERTESLTRELSSLRVDLEASRAENLKVARIAEEAKIEQDLTLGKQRSAIEALVRELASAKKEAEPIAAEAGQKQALEQRFKQERERAESLTRELSSLRVDLEASRAESLKSARVVLATKAEQNLAFKTQQSNNEALSRELSAAKKEAEERSELLAAARFDALQATEATKAIVAGQKVALAAERDRADAITRELASVKSHIGASEGPVGPPVGKAPPPREPVGSLASSVVAPTTGLTAASEPPRSQAQSSIEKVTSSVDPKPATVILANAAFQSPQDEQRLLALANAFLRRADISGARPLLDHAIERGSARAAFMLAETYDARVLESWRARGVSGDSEKARVLYLQAQAGGIAEAKKRIETLK